MGLGEYRWVWECFRILAYLRGTGIRNHVRQRTKDPVSTGSQLANAGLLLRAWGVQHGGSRNDISSMMTVTTHPDGLVLYTYAAECQSILAVTMSYAQSSNRPYPTCSTSRVVPSSRSALDHWKYSPTWAGTSTGTPVRHTLGRLTSGTTTTLTALGALLGATLASPPGWYWYLPSLEPDSHGMLFLAMATGVSDVDWVGVRPRKQRNSQSRNSDVLERCQED
jgi:hypothetical protein